MQNSLNIKRKPNFLRHVSEPLVSTYCFSAQLWPEWSGVEACDSDGWSYNATRRPRLIQPLPQSVSKFKETPIFGQMCEIFVRFVKLSFTALR